jgi:hypothetical protein
MEPNQPILDGIDPDIADRLVNRRDAVRKGATASAMLTWGLRLGSVPVAIAAMTKEAFAQAAPQAVIDVLQFALILEHLENEFYKAVLGTSAVAAQNSAFAPVRGLIAAAPQAAALTAAFTQIQKHEQQHVDFLRATLTSLGATPPTITANDFDFTGGNGGATPGPFVRATTELEFLLLAAQAFEDTGVRAYKGQASNLFIPGNATADTVLESALRIHSVEARHAAKIRRVRRQRNPTEAALRFSGYVRGSGLAAAGASMIANPPAEVVTALNLIYGGTTPESNTSHPVFNDVANAAATIDAATVTGANTITGDTQAEAARMAFDEPLTKAEVLQIVGGFIKDDASRGLP